MIGMMASICTGVSLLPQLIKIVKEKKAGDISSGMLAVLFIGLALWIYYGYKKEDWIIVVSNAFSWTVNVIIVVMYLKYKQKK